MIDRYFCASDDMGWPMALRDCSNYFVNGEDVDCDI